MRAKQRNKGRTATLLTNESLVSRYRKNNISSPNSQLSQRANQYWQYGSRKRFGFYDCVRR